MYDSSGVSTKSPHIPVRVKGESNDTSSKNDGSKTKQQVTSETAGTYSESIKATSEDGGNEAKSTMTTTTSTTTGTRSGYVTTTTVLELMNPYLAPFELNQTNPQKLAAAFRRRHLSRLMLRTRQPHP